MSDNPLNAQQLQAIRNEAIAAVQKAIDAMQLRKWSVEQAFSVTSSLNSLPFPQLPPQGSTGAAVNAASPMRILDPMALAKAIYDFVAQAAVVKVDVS